MLSRLLCSCILTPNKAEFERLIAAAIDMLSAKIQQQPSAAERGYYTALLSELCLVEPEGLTSNHSSFHSGVGARSTRTSTCTASDISDGAGAAAAAVGLPSSYAVRRVQALSAALGGVTIMRKVSFLSCKGLPCLPVSCVESETGVVSAGDLSHHPNNS